MVIFAYLLGSVPTGFLLGTLSGVDVRRAGSGNVGATNVARVVGNWQGLMTLIADVVKGFIPVFLSPQLGFTVAVTSIVAFAAFIGHLYPLFLRFHGGKGVATALGVFLGVAPTAAFVLASIFLLVALTSRRVSLASMVAAFLAPVALWLFSYSPFLIALSLVIAISIAVRHRENIQRLISGMEPKFKF